MNKWKNKQNKQNKQNKKSNRSVQHDVLARNFAVGVLDAVEEGRELGELKLPESMRGNNVFLVLEFPKPPLKLGLDFQGQTPEATWLQWQLRVATAAAFGPFVAVSARIRFVRVESDVMPLAVHCAGSPGLESAVDVFRALWTELVKSVVGCEVLGDVPAEVN